MILWEIILEELLLFLELFFQFLYMHQMTWQTKQELSTSPTPLVLLVLTETNVTRVSAFMENVTKALWDQERACHVIRKFLDKLARPIVLVRTEDVMMELTEMARACHVLLAISEEIASNNANAKMEAFA